MDLQSTPKEETSRNAPPVRHAFKKLVRAPRRLLMCLLFVLMALSLAYGALRISQVRHENDIALIRSWGGLVESAPAPWLWAPVVIDRNLNRLGLGNSWVYHVDVRGLPVTDSDMEFISRFSRLTILRLDNTRVTDNGLALIERMPFLYELKLDNTLVSDDSLEQFGKHLELGWLSLNGTNISDKGLRHLSHKRDWMALELSRTNITDDGLDELALLSHVYYLDLSGNSITDKGVCKISNVDIKILKVARTHVTDAGMDCISRIPKLERLDLAGTKMTLAGLKTLRRYPRRLEISIRETSISEDEARKILPNAVFF